MAKKVYYALDRQVKEWIEWQLRHYHDSQLQLAEYRQELMPSSTPAYGQNTGGGSGGESRPTEVIALRLTTAPHIKYLEETVTAIAKVLDKLDELDRGLICLHYFRGTLTVEGAAMRLNIGKSTAYERINRVLYALALEFGIVSI